MVLSAHIVSHAFQLLWGLLNSLMKEVGESKLGTVTLKRISHLDFLEELIWYSSFCLQIVLYLRMCLAHSAGVVPTSQSLADMQDHAPAIGRYIRTLMSSSQATSSSSSSSSSKSGETNPVQIYIGLLQQLLAGVGGRRSWCLGQILKHLSTNLILNSAEGVPGGLAVGTLRFHHCGLGSVPGLGTEVLHQAPVCSGNEKKKKR